MRKRLMISVAVIGATVAAFAGPRYEEFTRITLTNTATNTATLNPKGLIDAVYVMAPTTGGVTMAAASVTGSVTVVSAPAIGSGLSSTTLFSDAAVTNAAVSARPRFAPTDAAGSALSSLTVFEPFLNVGDTITVTVEQTAVAQTSVTWRVFLKMK